MLAMKNENKTQQQEGVIKIDSVDSFLNQNDVRRESNDFASRTDIQTHYQVRRTSFTIVREDSKRTSTDSNVIVEQPVSAQVDAFSLEQDVKRDLTIDYHSVNLDTLLNKMETDAKLGLSDELAEKRLQLYGPNVISVSSKWLIVRKVIILLLYIYIF